MADLDDLIARLEAATEGSRLLDARIHILTFDPDVLLDAGNLAPPHRAAVWGKFPRDKLDGWEDGEGLAAHVGAPCYTTSIDAALTLVTQGKWWVVGAGRIQIAEKLYGAFVYRADEFDQDGDPIVEGSGESAASAALALCIAARRARQAGE